VSKSDNTKAINSALSVLGNSGRVASQKKPLEVIETDIPEVNDYLFGTGGIPCGRIIELYAPESVGKSTFAYWLIGQVQKREGTAALFDAEGSYLKDYGEKYGVNNDELIIPEFFTGEDALFKLKLLLATNTIDLIVVDSIPGLQPSKNVDDKDGSSKSMNQKLARADMLTNFFNDITGGYRVNGKALTDPKGKAKYIKDPITGSDFHKSYQKKTCIIFINHAKNKVGVMFGDKTSTPGGRSLKFASSMRIGMEYQKKSKQINDLNQPLYKVINVTAAKNKLAPPLVKIQLKIATSGGIDIYEGKGDSADDWEFPEYGTGGD